MSPQMNPHDAEVLGVIRRSKVARIATLSRNGRPSINPLYFTCHQGHVWLGTVDWTLAARNVQADPRVSLLFEGECRPADDPLVRITGHAIVRTDPSTQRAYNLRVAFRYVLTPGAVRNSLQHFHQLKVRRAYHAQSGARGKACVIDVVPERAEFLHP